MNSPIMIEVPPYYDYLRLDMLGIIPRIADKVLEVGCGSGRLIEHIHNSEYWGVESNKQAAMLAENRGCRVLNARYSEVDHLLPDNYFDLVIANDVIEHMESHEDFLNNVKKKMIPTGVICGSVPNARNISVIYNLLARKDWQYQPSGIMDNTHLRWFTKKSLRRSLEDVEFTVDTLVPISYGVPTSNPSKLAVVHALSFFLGKDIFVVQYGFKASL